MSPMALPFVQATSIMLPADAAAESVMCRATVAKSTHSRGHCTTSTTHIGRKDGQYVFVERTIPHAIAALQAEIFPREGFAVHLGQSVTVRDIVAPGWDPLMPRVHRVKKHLCTLQKRGDRQYYGTSLGGV